MVKKDSINHSKKYFPIAQEQEEGLNMAIFYRRKKVRLKSVSTEELNIFQQPCLLISLKFEKGKDMQRRKTCILFMWKDKMYSPSALLQKLKGLDKINQTIYVIAFSESDGYLYIEFLKYISKELAIVIAKELSNYSNGPEKNRLVDILLLFERFEMFVLNQSLRQFINPEESMTRLESDLDFNDNSNHIQKNVINSNQENYSLSSDRKKSPEQKIKILLTIIPKEKDITTQVVIRSGLFDRK
ncbi:unnamed protein product [Mytilus coruscus]|uniref:Uncharacterized protein n=1 Tax=Mytilus coruscus TaxID=42192 RepID=A0A6J8D695_MYTCO|nr:unnamed protein product [Mytilus coruscus]